jgi:hypothetical protein
MIKFEEHLRKGDVQLNKGQLIQIRFTDHCDTAPALGDSFIVASVSLYFDEQIFTPAATFADVTSVR